jgi:hypothetical protein
MVRDFRPRRLRQQSFEFTERPRRLARRFKVLILAFTTSLVILLIVSTATGRHLARWLETRSRWAVLRTVGLEPERKDVENDWQRKRLYDIEQTRSKLRSVYAEYQPPMRQLLDFAGLDPGHALLRWGNFDRTLYLPATVFEADDTGRSYRFRPNTRSIWVRNLRLKGGILAYFPIPVSPRLAEITAGTGALVVSSSVQTTNSWGLRGPEPDLDTPIRGIILGDSYMQGLFVGDDETPSECLKRQLTSHLKTPVEILNTGHLGYSPEQEFFTLQEYAARFHPQFVVLSLFANDFGDLFEVLEGRGDQVESRHWMAQITQFCRSKNLLCLVVPAPWINQIEGERKPGFYPGNISNSIESPSLNYLDPIEAFTNAYLREMVGRIRNGKPTTPNPLFNGQLGDGHFSPLGCEVWARAVAARLLLLLEKERLTWRRSQ